MKGQIIEYNAGNASKRLVTQDFQKLGALPHVIAIGGVEVADRRAEMESVDGFWLLYSSVRHYAWLIRNGVKVQDHELVKISNRTYVGNDVKGAKTHNGYAPPKYLWCIKIDGQWFALAHYTPSSANPKHKAARKLVREQQRNTAAWILKRKGVVIGDFNGSPLFSLFIRLRLVAKAYSRASHKRSHIDIMWVPRKLRKKFRVLVWRALSGYSSDHKPMVFEVEW